ncbi:MAG: ATP-grasp domain-containing protein [bacterium]
MSEGASVSKLRVGVFFGGKGIEREVSFNSGRTICDHINEFEYDTVPIFQRFDGELFILPWHFMHRGKISDFINRLETEAKKISWDELKNLIDFMYIATHGRFGEDGTVQGFLEILGIPYLGAKVFGSSLGMNKIMQKTFFRTNGIDVAKDVFFSAYEIKNLSNEIILKKLKENKIDLSCVVKPNNEGSSFGVAVVEKKDDLLNAIKKTSKCDNRFEQDVIVEEKIEGMEFVCVCLQKINKNDSPTSHKASGFVPQNSGTSPDVSSGMSSTWFALPITQVIPEDGSKFYDYDQKYMPGRASKITPANCSAQDQKKIQDVCIKATEILDFSTISRIDGFLTKDGKVVLIDPNALTGMAPATFLFHQAAEIGMSHTQLINYLIEVELQNYKRG